VAELFLAEHLRKVQKHCAVM